MRRLGGEMMDGLFDISGFITRSAKRGRMSESDCFFQDKSVQNKEKNRTFDLLEFECVARP